MNGSTKTALVAAMFLVALGGGLYLSGQLTLMLLGVDMPLTWRTWWDYHSALVYPQYAPYVWKIKFGGIVGFGLPALAWVGCLVLLLRSARAQTLHGDARFATRRDLVKQGLLKDSPDGIVVGKFGRKLIRLSGQQFVILAAPTRSGKGVGVVVPNLLTYRESVVVLDIKQENFDLTSGWRKSQGQEVYLFNPFAEDRRTHRWNPLSYVTEDPAFRISDIMAIGSSLYPDSSAENGFWISQARNAFVAFTLYLFEKRDKERAEFAPVITTPTLGRIFRLSIGVGDDLKATFRALRRMDYASSQTKQAFDNLTSQAKDTFSSILGTFREPLNGFLNPVLDAATSADDFLLTDLRRRKMTIYIGIQPNKLAESRVIINLFFSQLIKINTKELPRQNSSLKHQCLLLMDEFTAIGKVDVLASAVAFIAGYNLRLLPIIQSLSQLDAVYGKDIARSFVTNHALQIVFTPREQRDANDYSEMLGATTVRKESVSEGSSRTKSYSDERRSLMLPQELKAMSADKELFLYEGIPHPVMCSKIRYYSDRRFKSRLMSPVTIEPIAI